MMKVLHVIDSLGHGGAEHQLALLVRSLDPTQITSSVCHLYSHAPLAGRIREHGIEVHDLAQRTSYSDLPRAIAALLSHARRVRPDIIHTSLVRSDLVGGVVGALLGVPVVGTLCSISGDEQTLDNPHQALWKLRVETAGWGAALRRFHSRTIVISSAVRESAMSAFRLPAHRLSLVYRAVDEKASSSITPRPDVRAALELNSDDFVILAVGRLVPVKGHRYLIEAMPRVSAQFPRARLLIVGEGWLESELRALVNARGLDSHVRFLGRRSDVPSLMAAADVFAFPSLWEGLGVARSEAAMRGGPCITSDRPPMTEVIEHGKSGICVPIRDPGPLADAILGLAADRARARALGDEARRQALERFDRLAIARETQMVYESALRDFHRLRTRRTHRHG